MALENEFEVLVANFSANEWLRCPEGLGVNFFFQKEIGFKVLRTPSALIDRLKLRECQ